MDSEKPSAAPAIPSPAPQPAAKIRASQASPTRQQRDALFEQAAKGMVPDHPQKKPEDPLRHWWPQINKKLKEGYSARQILAMTRAPGIDLKTSLRSIQRLINEHKAGVTTASKPAGSTSAR